MSEPGESEESGPDVSAVGRNKLDPAAIRKSIARAQKSGKLPNIPEKQPEKVSAPPSIKEPTPPFVEDIPQDPSKRTHEEAMDFFHKAEKEYRLRPRTHEEAMSFFHKAQNPPQAEQTPAPASTEDKNVIERLFPRLSGKS
jgi:hypothetical protein